MLCDSCFYHDTILVHSACLGQGFIAKYQIPQDCESSESVFQVNHSSQSPSYRCGLSVTADVFFFQRKIAVKMKTIN